MTNLKLIGICGYKRHGKDTLGDYLVKHHGYTKIAFADALKDACKCIFGFNDEQLYGNLKETNDEFWKTSPRKALQFVGTELFRLQISELLPEVNEDIWVKVVENKILQNPDKRYVITDVRFANELALIKKYKGLSIKVQRDIKIDDEHISESFIDQLETDCIIKNSGTLEQLYEKLNNILAFKMYCKYVKISNFDDIKLIDENTLYVFDIDETLMVYDGIDRKWWKKKMVENNENESLTIDEWLIHVSNNQPKHTHASSFNTFLENVNNSNIVCLTARKESLKYITEQHLEMIGVKDIPVYYSNGTCKGKVLKEIIIPNYSTIKNIVFVDDNKNNISSVNKEFYNENIKVHCYYFMYNQ
jgi:hypothetical protein